MTSPNDDQLDTAFEELLEAAKKKAYSEASRHNEFSYEGNPQNGDGATEFQKQRIEEGLKNLRERLDLIYTPHPSHFDELTEPMRELEIALGIYNGSQSELEEFGDNEVATNDLGPESNLTSIDTAADEITKDWDGLLRDNLVDEYLTKLSPAIVGTHGSLARFLRVQADTMRNIYVRRRSDAKKIANKGTEAIEAIKDSKGGDVGVILAAIAAVGTLVGGVGPAIAGWGLASQMSVLGTSSAANAAASFGGNFVEDEKENELSADTVEGVFDKIYQALNKSDETMEREEQEVVELMQYIEGLVAEAVSKGPYEATEMVPPWPELVKTSDVGDIREEMTSWADDNSDGEGR